MTWPAEIGHGVTLRRVEYEGQWVGIIEEHPSRGPSETHKAALPAGERCSGYVHFRGMPGAPSTTWIAESLEPLTLQPSVLCRTCGQHGYITGGKWVPA